MSEPYWAGTASTSPISRWDGGTPPSSPANRTKPSRWCLLTSWCRNPCSRNYGKTRRWSSRGRWSCRSSLRDFPLNEVRDDLAINLIRDTGIVEDDEQGLKEILNQIHDAGLDVAKSKCHRRKDDNIVDKILTAYDVGP